MKQSDYLMAVGRKPYLAHKLQREESIAKDEFRLELEHVAIDALTTKYPGLDPSQIKLKCYGSLANGFGLAGCDMDLLLSLPDYPGSGRPITGYEGTTPEHIALRDQNDADAEKSLFKSEVQRVLEKAFLDRGYGARLLTKTRVPILRMCQSPSPELLQNLREHQLAEEQLIQEKSTGPKVATGPAQHPVTSRTAEEPADVTESVASALDDLSIAESDPPPVSNSKSRGNAGLEFVGDVGIQCDINFGNFVALHNSALLRTYHGFDSRVGDLGVFVKIWTKTRDINTPYLGTLSSYGYILMVLHYLMNVVNPPLIPNLQALAKTEDGWHPERPVPLFEGFDVRFLQTPQEIQNARSQLSKNNESVGQLLRGFFRYYGTKEGFHWTRDVISIREPGGQLSKAQKGWTEAKWAEKSSNQVRLRYLMAIEDPFEVEHNVARTVGHHGIVAIRDEFRRAWSIIEKVGTDLEAPIEELLTPVTDRGDTLRRDQDFHRQKQLQMKQELEARERALLQKVDDEDPDANTDGMSGTFRVAQFSSPAVHVEDHHSPPRARLTSMTSTQAHKRQTGVPRRFVRQIKSDSDDEGDNRDESFTLASSDVGSVQSEAQTTPESLRSNNVQAPQPRTGGGGNLSLLHEPPRYGVDDNGNILAWDVSDQDGRWLHWRDEKIRHGAKLQFSNPTLRDLHEKNPYEPNRPNPYLEKPYNNRFEGRKYRKVTERPPWPAPNVKSQNLTDEFDGYPEVNRSGDLDSTVPHAGAKGHETHGDFRSRDVRIGAMHLEWEGDRHGPDDSLGDMRPAKAVDWDEERMTSDEWAENPYVLRNVAAPNVWNRPITARSLKLPDGELSRRGQSLRPGGSSAAFHGEAANAVHSSLGPGTGKRKVARDSGRRAIDQVERENTELSSASANMEDFATWDNSIREGRWLLWRDDLIRKGQWIGKGRKAWFTELDELFPYNSSELTSAEWEAKNQELREHHRQIRVRAAGARSKQIQSHQQEHAWNQASRQGPWKLSPADPSQSRPKKVISFENKNWDDIVQHGYHDHDYGQVTQDNLSDPQENTQAPTLVEPLENRRSAPSSNHEDEDSHPDSVFVRSQRLAFFVKSDQPGPSARSTSSGPWEGLGAPQEAVLLNESSRGDAEGRQHVDGEKTLEIAPTLDVEAESSELLREEDPRIMPIPRQLGFQFDPRQIQDLAIIARGGNGCARAGAEFSIEEDYEWGGGGMMGYRESTGGFDGHESASGALQASGRGDEDGLLKELPGEVE